MCNSFRTVAKLKTLLHQQLGIAILQVVTRVAAASIALVAVGIASVWLVALGSAFAADHIDINANTYSASIDISDVFAFPVASQDGNQKLALIMALYPGASAPVPAKLLQGSWFSDAVDYRFRIRRATIEGTKSNTTIDTDDEEFDVSCRFTGAFEIKDGRPIRFQWFDCKVFRVLKQGLTPYLVTSTRVKAMTGNPEDESGGTNSRLLAFAGLRADPFFISQERIINPLGRKAPFFPPLLKPALGINPLADKNVLGIAVELDIQSIFGSSELGTQFAIVGNVTLKRKVGDKTQTLQIDRMGRVEVTNFWVGVGNRSIKPTWNGEDSFNVSQTNIPTYRSAIQKISPASSSSTMAHSTGARMLAGGPI